MEVIARFGRSINEINPQGDGRRFSRSGVMRKVLGVIRKATITLHFFLRAPHSGMLRPLILFAVLSGCVHAIGKMPGERQAKILDRAHDQALSQTVSAQGQSAATGDEEEATAVLAAGCFWGVELAFARLPGVVRTEVGYVGGKSQNPTYKEVSRGDTLHAEAVRITYKPSLISYEDLLAVFFEIHDPTTLNRQGNDVGTQYRSAIFFASSEERDRAGAAIYREQDTSWERFGNNKIVTTLEQLGEFWPAEEYHRM